jgi:hypothetical protein
MLQQFVYVDGSVNFHGPWHQDGGMHAEWD